jgi:hypothetical protein
MKGIRFGLFLCVAFIFVLVTNAAALTLQVSGNFEESPTLSTSPSLVDPFADGSFSGFLETEESLPLGLNQYIEFTDWRVDLRSADGSITHTFSPINSSNSAYLLSADGIWLFSDFVIVGETTSDNHDFVLQLLFSSPFGGDANVIPYDSQTDSYSLLVWWDLQG